MCLVCLHGWMLRLLVKSFRTLHQCAVGGGYVPGALGDALQPAARYVRSLPFSATFVCNVIVSEICM